MISRFILLTSILVCGSTKGFSQQAGVYNILNYGAKGDGKSKNTSALQAAIDDCNKHGGGEILVLPGIFIIGTIHLKSNIHIHLEAGAVIRGSANLQDYESYIPEKPFAPIHKGMFFTVGADNIVIDGSGEIDGNGDTFFERDKAKTIDTVTTRYTRQKNNFRHVESGIGDGPFVPKDRPYQMLMFAGCHRVTIKDVFIKSAPFWCMHFADCDAVHVSGIRLWNNLLAPNSDGIDITSCTNVIVDGCDIRAGDDALAIVGYDHHFEIPGFSYLRHLSGNVVVSNCNLQSYSSGIRIGFLDQNTVENIIVSNVNITNSTRGIGIFLRDEGSLKNISFSNIHIETRLRTGDWWGNGEPIHISAIRGKEGVVLGSIENVSFNGITCRSEAGILVFATAESVIKNLVFKNIVLEFVDSRLNDVAGGNIDLRGVIGAQNQIFSREIPGFLAQHVDGLLLSDFKLTWTRPKMPFLGSGIEVTDFKNLVIYDFTGIGAPNVTGSYPIKLKNGVGFKTNALSDRIKLLNVVN